MTRSEKVVHFLVIAVVIFFTVCIISAPSNSHADDADVGLNRWSAIIQESSTVLDLDAEFTLNKTTCTMTLTYDMNALFLFMSRLSFDDLRLVISYHQALEIEPPTEPVYTGDKNTYLDEVASYLVDLKYIIIEYTARALYEQDAVIL